MPKRKRDIRRLFSRDAYTPNGRPGFTPPKTFLRKAGEMAAQEKGHQNELRVRKIKIGPLKARMALKIGIPLSPFTAALTMRDLYQARNLRKRLKEKPRTAAMLAREFNGTAVGPFFAKASADAQKLAAKKAKQKKKAEGKKAIKKIAERRRGIQQAEKKWKKKGKQHPEEHKGARRRP